MADCGHTCCDERSDPHHDHFLSPEKCPACAPQAPPDSAATVCRRGTKPHPMMVHGSRGCHHNPWCSWCRAHVPGEPYCPDALCPTCEAPDGI